MSPDALEAAPLADAFRSAAFRISSFRPEAPADLDVSIIMPCLNERRTLAQCIEPARAALRSLQQEHGHLGEIVIVDNGSTDGSQEVAESLGARVLHSEVRGYGAALRAGMLAARGRNIVMGFAGSVGR
jgi:GT2 family glycosyltransferase